MALPQGIGRDVDDLDSLAPPGRGAAGTDGRADRHTIEQARVFIRQSRRRQWMQQAVGIDRHQGTDRFGRELFGAETDPARHLCKLLAARDRLQHLVLQLLQRVAGSNIGHACSLFPGASNIARVGPGCTRFVGEAVEMTAG
jgi:hypothetical protein